MNKLLIICGPTATGKTDLAIHLTKSISSQIISADSRQVYKHLDIATGKDILDFKYHLSNISINNSQFGYYQKDHTKIWGLDLVEPNQDFSVSNYLNFAYPIINHIHSQNQLPIIVGGTGFYIKALTQPPTTVSTPPDLQLRSTLETRSVTQLQNQLQQLDLEKLNKMNNSDRNNPRRLIRAIEIATSKLQSKPRHSSNFDSFWIGLKAPLKFIDQNIQNRVKKRVNQNITQEIKTLEKLNLDWNANPATATGYKQWKAYLDGQITQNQAIDQWITAEKQYARRQLTWFKKQPNINWIDITQPDYKLQVEHLIKPWYS